LLKDPKREGASLAQLIPNGPSQEGIEGIQPVVHVLVTVCLQQDTTVLGAHSKCVGRL
jgi:hypothetical protein